MFSTIVKTNFNIWVTFILASANGFNLDQSKILSFGKELNIGLLGKKLENLPPILKISLCPNNMHVSVDDLLMHRHKDY